jgi:ectoine hydroxylase-related dioxygenase (phytanoyl-CoA dioxygenase family)
MRNNKVLNQITNQEYRAFEQDGFLILRDCIDPTLIQKIKNFACDLLECKNSSKSIIKAMEELESSNKSAFNDFCNRMGSIPPVTLIALDNYFLNFAEKMLKTKYVHLFESAIFFNKHSVKRLQYDWHQESSYYPNAKEVITLWYPWLHKVNKHNGTMVMAKGGHKMKLDAFRMSMDKGLTQMRISDEALSCFEKIHCDLELGDAVLFPYNSPHKTGTNSSQVPRSIIVSRYSDKIGKFDGGWKE